MVFDEKWCRGKAAEFIAAKPALLKHEEIVQEYNDALFADEDVLKTIYEAGVVLRDNSGDAKQDRLVKIFRAVFRNMQSRAELVTKNITMGPIGFGIRDNKRSRQVETYNDVMSIFERRDEIIMGFLKEGKAKWHRKFKRFCDLMPAESLFERDMTVQINLNAPIMCIENANLTIFDGLTLSGQHGSIGMELRDFSFGEDSSDFSSHNFSFEDGKIEDEGYAHAMMYLQLRDELRARAGELLEKARRKAAAEIESISKLEEEFGREILLEDA